MISIQKNFKTLGQNLHLQSFDLSMINSKLCILQSSMHGVKLNVLLLSVMMIVRGLILK